MRIACAHSLTRTMNKPDTKLRQMPLFIEAIAQMVNPRSVVIVGMSSKPGGASYNVLMNLEC